MTGSIDPRLSRLLGGHALANLRERLRRHFERAGTADGAGAIRLSGLAPQEREALAALMGRPPSHGKSMAVDIAAINGALRDAGIAASLRHALELLGGPIVNRADARAQAQAQWSAVVDASRHHSLAKFLQTPAGLGLLKRLTKQDCGKAAALREAADAVLDRLPAAGLPRAQLAAETLGDAHALDADRAISTLVLAAWRHREGWPQTADDTTPRKAERARETWARAGVLVNELARPVLFLNLPIASGGGIFGKSGEPAYASLRQLLRSPPAWAAAGRTVYVCENPNLLAIAADHLGCRCAPLVCTDGMPAAAQRTLLSQLAAGGARLLYHGDFDWPGIRIANHVMQIHGAAPWRFRAPDYQAALPLVPRRGHRLVGQQLSASWDDALAVVMHGHAVAIPEESLATFLLEDLSNGCEADLNSRHPVSCHGM